MDTSAFANEEVSLPIIDDSFITPEKISLTKPLNSEYDWPRTPPSGLQPLAPEILTSTKITKELTEDYSRDKIEGSEHSWPRVPQGDDMIVREPPKQVMKNQNLDDPVSRQLPEPAYDYVSRILIPMFIVLAIAVGILISTELHFYLKSKKSVKIFHRLNSEAVRRAEEDFLVAKK